MTFSITLHPAGHSFPIEANETILNAALKQGYALPYSCREGSCGVCKGRVLQGSVDHGNFLGSILSAAERDAGMALFCCATPESDLVIEYREVAPLQGGGDIVANGLSGINPEKAVVHENHKKHEMG